MAAPSGRKSRRSKGKRMGCVITVVALLAIFVLLKWVIKIPLPDFWTGVIVLLAIISVPFAIFQGLPEIKLIVSMVTKWPESEVYSRSWGWLKDKWRHRRPLLSGNKEDPLCMIIHSFDDKDTATARHVRDTLGKLFHCQGRCYPWDGQENFPSLAQSRGRSWKIVIILSDSFLDMLYKENAWVNELQRIARKGSHAGGLAILAGNCKRQKELHELNLLSLSGLSKQGTEDKLVIGLMSLNLQLKEGQPSTLPGTETQSTETQSTETQSTEIVWTVPPSVTTNPYFIEPDIFSNFFDDLEQSAGKVCYLWGVTGVGKTTFVREYLEKHRPDTKSVRAGYRYVLWIDASSSTTSPIESGCERLYRQLPKQQGPPKDQSSETTKDVESEPPVDPPQSESAWLKIKKWLEESEGALKENGDRWVLVIDGCKKQDLAGSKILHSLDPRHGHVLVTMNEDPGTISLNAMKKRLEPLDEVKGARLLRHRVEGTRQQNDPTHPMHPHHNNWVTAKKISKKMSGIPLVITAAALYISKTTHSYETFFKAYASQSDQLAAILGELHAAPQKDAIAALYHVIIDEIKKEGNGADEILRLCAFLSPEPFPRAILNHVFKDPQALDKALASLNAKSFIERQTDRHLLSLLDLIRTLVREGLLTPEEKYTCAEHALKIVSKAFCELEMDSDLEEARTYLPHVLEGIKNIDIYKLVSLEAVRLLYSAGCYLQENSQNAYSKEAYDLLQRAYEMRKKMSGHQYPDLPTCSHMLAEFLRERSIRILSDHPSRLDLGVQKEQERQRTKDLYNEAISLISLSEKEGVQRSRPDVALPANVDRATVLNDQGRFYDDWGKYSQSLVCFAAALQLRQVRAQTEHLKDHLDYAISLNNIAQIRLKIYASNGELSTEYQEIKKKFEKALAVLAKGLEQSERDTQNTEMRFRDGNEHEKKLQKKRWGRSHAHCQSNLAAFYTCLYAYFHEAEKQKEHCRQAEYYYGQSIAYMRGEASQNDNYIDVLILLNNRAELYRIQAYRAKGSHKGTTEAYKKSLDDYKEAVNYYKENIKKPHSIILSITDGYKYVMEHSGENIGREDFQRRWNELDKLREPFELRS